MNNTQTAVKMKRENKGKDWTMKATFEIVRPTVETVGDPVNSLRRIVAAGTRVKVERSKKAEVRNPLIGLPASRRIKELPSDARAAIAELLTELASDAAIRAEKAWAKSKGPMAAYWKAVAVYAKHARVLCK